MFYLFFYSYKRKQGLCIWKNFLKFSRNHSIFGGIWREKIRQGHLFACLPTVFPRLIKFDRAEKKLQEIKQKLLSVFKNRESLREKETANDNGDVRVVNAATCLRFSVEYSAYSPEASSARFYREL